MSNANDVIELTRVVQTLERQLAARDAEIGHLKRSDTKQVAELQDALAARDAEVARLRAAIDELVKLKAMKDIIVGYPPAPDLSEVKAEYFKRKPLAWEAARAALAQPKEPT